MDWKLLYTTFIAVFLAELGDKTQIATLSFTVQSSSPWSIFIASSLALVLSSFLAVFLGSKLSTVIPMDYLKKISAIIFIVLGVVLLIKK